MKNLIGNMIEVHLKSSDKDESSIYGILIEVTEGELYVQNSETTYIWVIPRDNVKYCTISSLPLENKIISKHENRQEKQPLGPTPQPPKNQLSHDNILNIFVNNDKITSIFLPPSLDISVWNDTIANILASNIDVKNALTNRTQKSIDYYPGEVYINTDEVVETAQNTFSMNDFMSKELSPSELITRVQGFKKKE
ncbi:MAG: hypothetical protein WC523_00260 [Patescibacteria group bacterium]